MHDVHWSVHISRSRPGMFEMSGSIDVIDETVARSFSRFSEELGITQAA